MSLFPVYDVSATVKYKAISRVNDPHIMRQPPAKHMAISICCEYKMW